MVILQRLQWFRVFKPLVYSSWDNSWFARPQVKKNKTGEYAVSGGLVPRALCLGRYDLP